MSNLGESFDHHFVWFYSLLMCLVYFLVEFCEASSTCSIRNGYLPSSQH